MARIIVTALSAVTMLFLAISALSYRAQSLDTIGVNGTLNNDALNLTTNVTSDATLVAGNAIPRLFVVVLLVFVVGTLLLQR